MGEEEIRAVVKAAIAEYVSAEQEKLPAPEYQAQLEEERSKRQQLEQRVNELVTENQRSRAAAEQAEKESAIRAELHRLGVAKVDLAFKAVKDEIVRGENGALVGRDGAGLRESLGRFAMENPELLPARVTGGSGAAGGARGPSSGGVDLDKIRPGMSAEEMERVRQEIARVAAQALRGV